MTEPSNPTNNGHGAIRRQIMAVMGERGKPAPAAVLAELTGLRTRQVSNALVNMRRSGVARKVGRDQWQLVGEGAARFPVSKQDREPKRTNKGNAPTVLTGDLLEVVGTLKSGQVVARVVDTGRLYKVEPL